MAIETEAEVRARLAEIAPGAAVSSAGRSVERNAAVGGVPGSLHTRRDADGGSRGLDIVPGTSGLSMAELNTRLANSGLNFQERLNEGDHVHVGVDGRPSVPRQIPASAGPADVRTDANGRQYTVANAQGLAPEDTPESLTAAGYQQAADGTWFRYAPAAPQMLDSAYAERQAARESLALDQEDSEIIQASLVPEGVVNAAGAMAGDMAKGVFMEGAQSIMSGVKRGVNETMDLLDEAADWIETYVPGTLMWEGFDGDGTTPARIFLTTQNDAARRMAEAGKAPSLLSTPGRFTTSEAERPESVTGRVIEGVSQFATGFAGGGRVLRGWKTATKAGRIGKSMVQGALADFTAFDGNEARLSNLLAEHSPDAIAPMFEILAAKEDDPEIVGRFKNAVEGTLLGGAVEVLAGGVRALRAGRVARDEARAGAAREGLQEDPVMAMAEAEAKGVEMQAAVREALGNPEGPRFRVVREAPVDAAARADDAPEVITPFQSKVDDAYVATAGTTPRDVTASADNVFDLNLARINTPEDVQAAIVGMADRMAKDVNLARRGVVTDAQAIETANGMDWVQSMADRRPGQAMNKEEVIAYRMALNSSGTQLVKLAKAVEDNPTLANQFAFRRATSVHAAIQNEFFGARAEAGRALGAFRTEVGTPASYLRNVDSLIADMGGANSAVELARKIRQAAAKGDSELNQMVRGGAMARTREIIKLVYTNALLSGVGTPTINVAGNGMMLGLNLITRAISPRMAGMFGGNATTKVGEAAALVHGYQQAVRDIFRLNPFEAAERIKGTDGRMLPTALREQGLFRGMAPGLDDAAPAGIKLRAEREEAGMASGRPLSAGAWRVNEDSPLGRVLDIMQMVFEAPSNINSLTDDAFKTIAARGELHAQAFRKVTTEGLEGEVARARMAELLTNPTEDMLRAAEFEMHDLTFTRETPGMAAALGDLRRFMDNNPTPIPFGTVVFPFIKTPANLISTGIRYSPLAPFMRRFRDAMAEGGAAAETAKAQMALGTAMYSLFMGMAMDGDLTGAGPGNPGQRDALQRVDENGGTVFQPYSVRINDRWVSFERLDPVGQGMGLVADLADLFKNSDWDSDRNGEVDEAIVHGIMAMSSAFFDKTSLRGVMEIVQAMGDRTGAKGEKMIMSRASGAIPFSSALRMTRRGEDEYLRETHNVVTAMMNTMPGLSDDLPVQRDLWGRERTYQTGLGTTYDAIMPVQTRAAGGSAIDLEILNNGVSVTMPARAIDVMGESVSLKNRPDIYSEFVQLAGAPAFEHLNAVASGTHPDSEFYYGLTDGPGGGKAEYIKDVVSAYRSDARAQILDTYAVDLQEMAARRTLRREQVRGRE
jgi:hypothetical protein